MIEYKCQCEIAKCVISNKLLMVPTGIHSGLVLFKVCVSDLPYIINEAKIHLYADDMEITVPWLNCVDIKSKSNI